MKLLKISVILILISSLLLFSVGCGSKIENEILPIVREYIGDPLLKDNRIKFEELRKEIQKSEAEITRNGEIEDTNHKHFLDDVTLYLDLCEEIMNAAVKNDQTVRNDYFTISFQDDNVKRSAIDLTMQELNYGNGVRKEINKKIWET